MGTRQTTNSNDKSSSLKLPKGVYLNGDSIRIGFRYKGKYRKEKVPLNKINKTTLKHAEHLKIEVCNAIARGDFDDTSYAKYFPNSQYVKKLPLKTTNHRAKISDFTNDYIDFIKNNNQKSTKIAFKASMTSIVDNYLPTLIEDINFSSIAKVKVALSKDFAAKTASLYLSFVFAYIKYLQNIKVLSIDFDLSDIGRIKTPSNEPDPFSLMEYKQIMQYSRTNKRQSLEYTKLIFTLACYTGLRTGELCALSRDDIDLDRGVLDVNRNYSSNSNQFCVPKTKSGVRSVFLQPPAINAIKELLKTQEANAITVDIYEKGHIIRQDTLTPLLTSNSGSHFTSKLLYSRFSLLMECAGVRHRRPYQTRHTFACWNLSAHGNIAFIATQMGHRDFTELGKTYGKFMDEYKDSESSFIWQQLSSLGH